MKTSKPQYEETVKGIKYRLTVPSEAVEHYEAVRTEGSWIAMVSLAEKIENLTDNKVLKDKGFVTFSGRTWNIGSARDKLDSEE